MMFSRFYAPLRSRLSENRFLHCLGVMHTSVQLADRFGYDVQKAGLAGLLHDSCKEMPPAKLRKMLEKSKWKHYPLNEDDKKLWHAWAGEVALKEDWGIKNEEVGRAIRWHPTGHPDMEPLQMIVYLADFIEPGRKRRPGLDEIREVAQSDLHSAVHMALKMKIDHIAAKKGRKSHPWAIEAKKRVEKDLSHAVAV